MSGTAQAGTVLTVAAAPGVTPRLLRLPAAVETHSAYLADGGYALLDNVETLLAEVDRSGLLGRGGAAFPLGVKLRTVRAAHLRGHETVVVANGEVYNHAELRRELEAAGVAFASDHADTEVLLRGYLHWGLNQYHADPFAQSVVHHPSPVATPNNFLPAGDTHIVYPGKDGPLSSLRFEAHRIGIEDFEMLRRLREEKPGVHDRLVKKLFRSYTDYELSVRKYRKVRKRVIRKVEG